MSYGALGYWGVDLTAYDYPDIGVFTKPYHRWTQDSWSSDQVYVFRFEVMGLPCDIQTAAQAYPLIEAYVAAMPTGNKNQNIRGITLKPGGSGCTYLAEIVFTDAGGVHLNTDRAGTTLEKMMTYLRLQNSPAEVSKGKYAAIDSDEKQINSFWFSKPVLWSSALYDSAGGADLRLGFTEAFVKQRKGVWLNSSTAKPQYELPPYEPPPISPPRPRPSPGGMPGSSAVESEEIGILPLVLVGAAAGLAVYYLYGGKARV